MLGFRIIKIQGHSMEPALKAGSYALVRTSARFGKGDVVLFETLNLPPMVKRITDQKDDMYFLAGDNRNDSLDSRSFGWIPRKQILGKVIWH